ncbi:MAG: hypothetical protein QME49_02150 [bacterium]|nr:hypothetical protein [bacterium]
MRKQKSGVGKGGAVTETEKRCGTEIGVEIEEWYETRNARYRMQGEHRIFPLKRIIHPYPSQEGIFCISL